MVRDIEGRLLNPGDLVIIKVYSSVIPVLVTRASKKRFNYIELCSYNIDKIKNNKKIYIRYLVSIYDSRFYKINESVLGKEGLECYKLLKQKHENS